VFFLDRSGNNTLGGAESARQARRHILFFGLRSVPLRITFSGGLPLSSGLNY